MIFLLLVCHRSITVSYIHFTWVIWMYSLEPTTIEDCMWTHHTHSIIQIVFLAVQLGWWGFLAFLSGFLWILTPELSNVQWIQVSVWTQYGHSVSLTSVCCNMYVSKHKNTTIGITRELWSLLEPIMCSLGAWYFPFRGQLLSPLFTPHEHSWRMQLCLENLPCSGTEECDC